jgi:hypothetical protein
MISAYYHALIEGSPLMRGSDERPGYLFSYGSAEARVPQDHPLRPVRLIVDAALRRLSPRFAPCREGENRCISHAKPCAYTRAASSRLALFSPEAETPGGTAHKGAPLSTLRPSRVALFSAAPTDPDSLTSPARSGRGR